MNSKSHISSIQINMETNALYVLHSKFIICRVFEYLELEILKMLT
jgi:hypothetical protein